ncbi:LysR substrate-binding domain-containing protein [Phreatobacter sp.]|uniref:LysR family transcriptional regulator n=1 Tax=Phreatobacter sp. TaxID=1966341 RepID=UPI003F70C903
MREVDLRRIDLNLLVVLDALLDERSVTRAAIRLGISQPAASRALGRLRALFADALLVDGPRGYLLSVRAEELRPALRQTLAGIGAMLEASAFEPAKASGEVRLLMTDLEAAVLGPRVLAQLAREAPAVDLVIVPPGPAPMEALETGAADAAAGVIDQAPAGILRRTLYEDRLVTFLRHGHPAAGHDLTLDRYLAFDHIAVSITGRGMSAVDERLSALGHSRRVRVRVPNFLAAAEIAASSDMAMTLPASLAGTAMTAGRFVTVPPPIGRTQFALSLAWHARHQDAPRHVWLRRLIVTAAQPLECAGPHQEARGPAAAGPGT